MAAKRPSDGRSRWNKLACLVGAGREYWRLATTTRYCKGETQMSATFRLSPLTEGRPFYLAIIAGLACAFVIGKALPSTMDAVSAIIEPLCANSAAGSTQDVVEPISSHALPNVPGKRVTIVRVFYGPGGFTPRAPACRFGHRLCHQGRNPLAIGGRSGRDVRGRSVVLRAARRRASGLGQCQHDRACRIDRGVRG